MVMVDWDSQPLAVVPLASLVWPCHDIDPRHVHAEPGVVTRGGAIHVERLVDGSLFVHDGRHRAIRAIRAGARVIAARVVE